MCWRAHIKEPLPEARRGPAGRRGTLASVLLLLATIPGAALAQVPDSARADSLARDTVDYTARFLEAQSHVGERLPVLPRAGYPGPAPAAGRMVFTRDSIEWTTAGTLADLLAEVPGVFAWRAGWLLEPELADFRARGASGVRYFVDGVPFLPVGPDSTGIDPARFALGLYQRVEIERWPDELRVYLSTRRHDRVAPASRLEIGTGDRDVARYQGTFEKRWDKGVWLGLGGEFMTVPEGTIENGDRSQTQFWGVFGLSLTRRLGVEYQLMTTDIKRDPVVEPITGDTVGRPIDGARHDQQLRVSWGGFGLLGWHADAHVAKTSWSGDGIEQTLTQYRARIGHRGPISSIGLTVGGTSRRNGFSVVGDAGWSPAAAVTLRGEGGWGSLPGGRREKWLGLQAGLRLPGGFRFSGSGRLGDLVASPAVRTDTTQPVRAAEAMLGWSSRPVTLEVGVSHTSAFNPAPFQPYRSVATLRSVGATNWLTARVRLAPARWLTLDGWYSDPLNPGSAIDGQPPTHTAARLTLRSKFLRPYPSGTFDLKIEATMETWGTGTLGVDGTGAPVVLPGATFLTGFIQMELGGSFRAFYRRSNLLGAGGGYLAGFPIPAYVTMFGVRWDFLN